MLTGFCLFQKWLCKELTLYALLGAEFSRFKARINRTLIVAGVPNPVTYYSYPKGISSSAAVIGLGVSKELGNWSLFAEGQCKFYQTKKFETTLIDLGVPMSQFLKFSPKFASVMVGVKFKLA